MAQIMFSITNNKVAGFTPRWAEFRGFSLLFDNPGDCLQAHGPRLDLACDVGSDPALGFYRSLRDGLTALDPDLLTAAYGFCPLPPPSYHVTVWDGGNADNCAQITGEQRPKLEAYLAGLPDNLPAANDLTRLASASPLVQRRDWDIEFEFDRLVLWGALVARLTPTEASRGQFEQFVEERRLLNAACFETFGIKASDNYMPHVSLGYFANREGTHQASAHLPTWNAAFAARMQGQTVTFTHAGLYGFTDIASFFTSADF